MMKGSIVAALLAMTSASGGLAQEPAGPVLNGGRFEQIALTVTDLDEALNFYREQLGLRLMFQANDMLFFDVGGVRLMIALDKERPTRGRPTSIVYFHVDDFKAALSRLDASGAKQIGALETVRSTSAGSLQLQQFEDEDGNMLAIMGFVPV
jgi:methylmalonyl-CoA/ethylmalonyl-CoA epimerase